MMKINLSQFFLNEYGYFRISGVAYYNEPMNKYNIYIRLESATEH